MAIFDWLLHQNVFPLRELNSILSGKGKGFKFEELFRSPFTTLAFEFDYKKEFTLKVYIQSHQTLQAIADTWIPKENRPTQPSNERAVSRFSLDHQ